MEECKNVVVVDDNPLHAEVFKEIGGRIRGVELLHGPPSGKTSDRLPDASLFLISMDLKGGCSRLLLHSLIRQHASCIIMCYSQSADDLYVDHYEENQHRLFLLSHDLLIDHLEDVFRRVATGGTLSLIDRDICREFSVTDAHHHVLQKLTLREMEVFCLFGHGCDAREVAERLQISKNTVDTHIKGMRRKFGGLDTTALRMNAIQMGRKSGCEVLTQGSGHICPHISDSIGNCPCRG